MTLVFDDINKFLEHRSQVDESVGFVPSLGGLHAGHISLIEQSKKDNEKTIVSIFLNPAQFNDPDDLKKYPSTWEADLKILQDLKVDIVLKPSKQQIYPDEYTYKVIEQKISKELCGATRPGHFNGVLTVVMKLLNIVTPDKAYFGEKDYQQLQLVRNMVSAFFINTEIIPCPTIREKTGVALSSRNNLLTEEHKKIAPLLYQTIMQSIPIEEMHQKLTSLGFRVDYLKEIDNRIFVAAFLGNVRLIDNVES